MTRAQAQGAGRHRGRPSGGLHPPKAPKLFLLVLGSVAVGHLVVARSDDRHHLPLDRPRHRPSRGVRHRVPATVGCHRGHPHRRRPARPPAARTGRLLRLPRLSARSRRRERRQRVPDHGLARPGSWESDALGQLVAGTVGYDADPVVLAPRRTLRVIVPLNVAQLVTEAYQDAPTAQRETMLPHVDDAAQVLYRAGEEWSAQHPGPTEGAPAEEWDAYNAAVDAQAAAGRGGRGIAPGTLRSHLPGLRRSLHRGRTRHGAGHRARRRCRCQGRDRPRGGVVGPHGH